MQDQLFCHSILLPYQKMILKMILRFNKSIFALLAMVLVCDKIL